MDFSPVNCESNFWHLKKCPLFDELSDEEMHALKESGNRIDIFRLNHELSFDERDDSIFIVKMGYLKLVRRGAGGKKESILFLGPGDVFQAVSRDAENSLGEHFRTVTPICILQVRKESFERLIRQFPNLAYTLTKISLFRVRKLEIRLAETALLPPEARLAKALIELSSSYGEQTSVGSRELEVQVTHGDLGKLIGTSREFVTRILKSFKDRRWIETRGRRIVVKDCKVLENLCTTLS